MQEVQLNRLYVSVSGSGSQQDGVAGNIEQLCILGSYSFSPGTFWTQSLVLYVNFCTLERGKKLPIDTAA
jgi:hypothetical protein